MLNTVFQKISPVTFSGSVREVIGPRIVAELDGCTVGSVVDIATRSLNKKTTPGIITGFSNGRVYISPFFEADSISPGAAVRSVGQLLRIPVESNLLGQVLNGLGEVEPEWASRQKYCCDESLLASEKITVVAPTERLRTGIGVLDLFTPLVCGQRIGIFAEPGVGKSSLLRSINRHAEVDIVVVALIGERKREVVEFISEISHTLGFERTVVVQATSAQTAALRVQAADTAMRIAEYYQVRGKRVLLQLDSMTRLFRAYRELGLAAGETPVRQGYPPSAFARLPQLIERAGATNAGSITALFTVLLSEGFEQDPMIEELKGLTDGHVILSKARAEQRIFPAVDVVCSLSRLSQRALSPDVFELVAAVRQVLAEEANEKELIAFRGNLSAVEMKRNQFCLAIDRLLTQAESAVVKFDSVVGELQALYQAYAGAGKTEG